MVLSLEELILNLDPKGYNMIISANLSNIYYNDSTIKQRILGDDRNPKQVFPEETLNSILEVRTSRCNSCIQT